MTVKKAISCLVMVVVGATLVAMSSLAQGGNAYKARLAPAPPLGLRGERGTPNPTPASFVAGIGTASATLSGKKLTVNGSSKNGVSSNGREIRRRITTARVICLRPHHNQVAAGDAARHQRNDRRLDGLTPAQVDALKAGKLYIQINSEGAPNGHLLGWLLK
jgi:hypothetical protein